MNTRVLVLVAASFGTLTAAAHADTISGTVTADNHYALYTSIGNTFTYHGGNETGPSGSSGTYNWSHPEPYSFQAGDFLYVAAWSDDAVAQSVLAEFGFTTRSTLLSGDAAWLVYATNINRGDHDPHPDAPEIATHVAFADSGNLWETPFVGGANGIQPWGTIAGISNDARWMWHNTPNDADPLQGGAGAGEMLIFRTVVPAPGAAALIGFAALAAGRRRR